MAFVKIIICDSSKMSLTTVFNIAQRTIKFWAELVGNVLVNLFIF